MLFILKDQFKPTNGTDVDHQIMSAIMLELWLFEDFITFYIWFKMTLYWLYIRGRCGIAGFFYGLWKFSILESLTNVGELTEKYDLLRQM